LSRVLLAGVIALLISILAGPKFIAFLRRNEFGQQIREEGPEHHVAKQGTPTMGGLLILLAATAGFLALSRYTVPALTVLFVTLGCGAIGFLDDFIKLTHRRSLGLNGRWKLILLALITAAVGVAAEHQHLPTEVYIPGVGDLQLSYAWYGLLFLVIAGAANGVNLTDGVDGLAAGTVVIALFTFASMIVISWIRSGPPGHRFDTKLDLAIIAAALIGGAIYGRYRLDGARRRAGGLRDLHEDDLPAAPDRRHLRRCGAVGDRAGLQLQVPQAAGLPDGADPASLRVEGVVGDEDHGALLGRDRDPLRARLRPVLPLLHRVPLSDVACDVAFRSSRRCWLDRLRRWPGAPGSNVSA
jgi:hypothetical protein